MLISIRKSGSVGLLRDVYENLYWPAFGQVAAEMEPLSSYVRRIIEGQGPPETDMLVAMQDGMPTGFVIYELYGQGRVCLMTFLAVAPAGRRAGTGRMLVSAVQSALPPECEAVFAECHKPEAVDPAQEPIDPAARIKALGSLGASIVPVGYVQPALSEGGERSNNLLLLVFPLQGHEPLTCLPQPVVQEFLRMFYEVAEGGEPPECPAFPTSNFNKYGIPVVQLKED